MRHGWWLVLAGLSALTRCDGGADESDGSDGGGGTTSSGGTSGSGGARGGSSGAGNSSGGASGASAGRGGTRNAGGEDGAGHAGSAGETDTGGSTSQGGAAGATGEGGGAGSAPCADACATDAQACSAGQVRRCEYGDDGCLAWSERADCPSGECRDERDCRSTVGATCAGRDSCRYEFGDPCHGLAPPPCQCDAYCATAGDCCADVATACSDARSDETAMVTALGARDSATIAAVVARGRFDPTYVFGRITDNAQIRLLIQAGAPIDVPNRGGMTPLMSSRLDTTTAGMLLDAGADLEARTLSCLTPLMVHIQNTPDNSAMAIFLIDRGADVNAVTPNRNTPLLFAISSFWGGPVRNLLEAGADPNWRNAEGMIPLTVAVRHSQGPMLRQLVRGGADINDVGPEGEPFWVYALVDNAPAASRLTQADDDLCEWVFSHPDLDVELDATGAAEAITLGLSRPPVAHYAAYLKRRGENDPTLADGELIDVYERSELRWLGEHLTKNGLDITPPNFRLAGRPRFVWNGQHYFPIDNAALPAGVADAGGADYTRRFVGFDPSSWTWLIDTRYVNLHGATSYQIGPENTILTITMTIPGQPSARSWQFSMSPYTRPYRP